MSPATMFAGAMSMVMQLVFPPKRFFVHHYESLNPGIKRDVVRMSAQG